MNIAIVGANGQVGKEISAIFAAWGHDVTAVVRNAYGAAYFHLQGIPYVIGDVVRSNEADSALESAEIIVVAAVARGDFKIAAKLNEEILRACVNKANIMACIYFFSSIRVFSRKIDKKLKWFDPLPAYDREKRFSEAVFRRLCQARGVRGRVFRLGHVIGPHQAKTRKFAEVLLGRNTLHVDSSAPSNVVHTVTICDAILKATQEDGAFIEATVVNQPQWSWRTVFEALGSDSEIDFQLPSKQNKRSKGKPMIRALLTLVRPVKKWLKGIKPYLGKNASATLYMESRRIEIMTEIEKLEAKPAVLSEFAYERVPGPFLDGLEETSRLLNETPGYNLRGLEVVECRHGNAASRVCGN